MTTEFSVRICSAKEADKALKKDGGGFKSVVSILSVNTDPDSQRPKYWVKHFRGPLLTLRFDDERPGDDPSRLVLPTEADISRLVQFARGAHFPMLVHCTAGVSRSAAAALIVAATVLGDEFKVEDVVNSFLHQPNTRMLSLADSILGTSLVARVAEWEASSPRLGDS